jgi:hypothetical protein
MAVDGKYDIVMDTEVARQRATLELKTSGGNLQGHMTGVMGTIEFTGGKIDGNNVSWKMHGKASAIYPNTYDWEVKATIDGDAITGVAFVDIMGDSPFTGVRSTGDTHDKDVLPWTDLGLPRYEAASVEWVKALDVYVRQKAAGKAKDVKVSWSCTYTDPPRHLLRDDGRDVIGYTICVVDGEMRAIDGPTPGADVQATYPYDPHALLMRLTTDQYTRWVAEHGASIAGKVQMKGDKEAARIINQLLAGAGNDVREEMWAQQTK